MMSGYVHFTEEQKQRANSVDLADFLQSRGEKLIHSGREWRWERHDSVTVRGNQWFRHSTEQGGQAIDFVCEFFHLPFPDAVTFLLASTHGADFRPASSNYLVQKQKAFLLPEANADMRRVFAYLIKQRCLDRDIISDFAHLKMLYEDKQYHNVVFVGYDENGTARHAHKKGTFSTSKPYRVNVEGSDPKYCFHFCGSDDALYVFEAPIDMLSFITLNKKSWQTHSYVALNGISEHALLHQLEVHSQLTKVVLCLDHDPAGIEATAKLTDLLHERGYADVAFLKSSFKDWNEDLKARNGITPLPAKGHPKLLACEKVCGMLVESCGKKQSSTNVQFDLLSYAEKLKFCSQPGLEMIGFLQDLTISALLTTASQYNLFGTPVSTKQLIGQLRDQYKVYQDHGGFRNRIEEIQKGAAEIQHLKKSPGIRCIGDKQNLINNCMNLALHGAKALIFCELEYQKQVQQQEQNTNFSLAI